MTIPQGLSAAETKNLLRRQVNMGCYMILGTVLITVVDILFLLLNVDFYITYSFACAFYLVWLGKGFDNGFAYSGAQVDVYTRTGLVMALVLLAALLLLWWLACRQERWLRISMAVLAVDAVLLLIFSVFLLEEPLSCLWELVIHGAVVWEMNKALSARRQLERLRRAPVQESPEPAFTEV